jgi:ACS family D-galactonate transporter-like MFS transporter
LRLKNHWKILIFLFMVTVLNYMDRQTLSVSSPIIQKEFGLNNEQLGLLFSAFYMSYAVSVALVGELIDRLSIRSAFVWIVTWWSVATMITAFSRSFWHLFGFRLLLGIGEAGLWPATAKLVSVTMRPQEKTLANSFYMAGGSLGLVIVQPLMIGLSLTFGWRMGFVVIGALSALWILAWLLWFTPAKEVELHRVAPVEVASGGTWISLLKTTRFWGFLLASFCGNTCLYFLINWLPSFLVQDRHFGFNLRLGGVLLIPFLGLDAGYLVSGFTVLSLSKKYPVLKVRRWILASAALLMVFALVCTPFASSDVLLVLVLFGTTFGMAVWNSNYLSGVEELSNVKPAAVAGVIGSVGALGGAITLWLIGFVSQLAGSFKPVFFLNAVLIVAGSIGILATETSKGPEGVVPKESGIG